jgi:signal transduction histidine kinase
MPEEKLLRFKASAHLQRLIGRELFRSEELAILELVKNAYDSGATRVEISIQPPSERIPSEIVIKDNGSGMNLDKFRNTFMFAGFSSRPGEVETAKRVPTGEKGIGRFASDRLGTALRVVTKVPHQARALLVDIDWTVFEDRRKEFNEVTVPFSYTIDADVLDQESGTTLRITRLRQQWDRTKSASLRRTLAELLNPYEKPAHFEMELTIIGSQTLSGPVAQPALTAPDLELRFKVDKSGYVSRRVRGTDHPSANAGAWTTTGRFEPDLIGIEGRFLYFFKRPTREQSGGFDSGVRVYRDGFKIEPLGSSSADWLGIAEKRAKRAGHAHIVPTRLFGFVSLSRIRNPKLVDTTSREALIESQASHSLVGMLKDQLTILEEIIQAAVAEPRWEENKERRRANLEQGRLQALSLMSSGLAHELRQPLQVLSLESDNIATRLSQLGIEDEDITEAHKAIQAGIARIDQNISTIASLTTGDLEANATSDLAEVVRNTCSYVESRCTAASIELLIEVPDEQEAFLNTKMLQIVLLNLLQNAMDALNDMHHGRKKQITVTLDKYLRRHRLSVADNADGIPEEIRPRIFTQFSTGKTGGMGLGLFLCHNMLTAARGEISFTSYKGIGTTFTVVIADSEG